jgi:hypothetical protein
MLSSSSSTSSLVPTNCPLKQDVDLSSRKRVSKACLECKKRHCRCDHQRPCARCAKLGLDCVDAPTCKRGPPKGTSYKKRKRSETCTETKKSSTTKKSKNIKNVQIKVEPGPYVTTNVTVVDEPSAKKRRLEAPTTTAVVEKVNNPMVVPQITVQQQHQNNLAAFVELNNSYLDAFNIKQEMESPMLMFNPASVDSVLTPTLLETPKLEQSGQFSYTELPDIEDLTVGMCMNSSCEANFNHHCMINELDVSPSIGLSSLFSSTPTLQQQPSLFLNLQTPLDTPTPFELDELSDFLVGNISGMKPTTSMVQPEEEFLLS